MGQRNILFISLFFLLVQVLGVPVYNETIYSSTQSPERSNYSLFYLEYPDDLDIEIQREERTIGGMGMCCGAGGTTGGGTGAVGGTAGGTGTKPGDTAMDMLDFNKMFKRISGIINVSSEGVLMADLGKVASKAFNMIPAMIRKPLTGIIKRVIKDESDDKKGNDLLSQKAAAKAKIVANKAAAKAKIIAQKSGQNTNTNVNVGAGGTGTKVNVGVGDTKVNVGVSGGYTKGEEQDEELDEEEETEERRRRRRSPIFKFTYN